MDFYNYKTSETVNTNKEREYVTYTNAYTTYQQKPQKIKNTLSETLFGLTNGIDKLNKIIETYNSNQVVEGLDTLDTTTYNNILKDRNNLEQKLYELYTNDYDSLYSVKSMVDSSVITGILWTVLATTMIYYIVVKI